MKKALANTVLRGMKSVNEFSCKRNHKKSSIEVLRILKMGINKNLMKISFNSMS